MRRHRSARRSRVPSSGWILIMLLLGGGLGVWWLRASPAPSSLPASLSPITVPHIHGLGWTRDGTTVVVAAHDGLRHYRQRTWSIPDGPKHDLMGYAPTDTGFYSSGHPDPSMASLPNPLGLVMSQDDGHTLTTLAFAGTADFHTMGVGYYSHAIYLFNPISSPTLAEGINYSLDDGLTWTPSAFPSLDSEPYQIAVHPTEPGVIVLATAQGIMRSMDYGRTITQFGPQEPIAAVTFHPDGTKLFFGSAALMVYDDATSTMTRLPTPLNPGEMIAGIAVNPVDPNQLVIASHERSIYWSEDGGQSWIPIALQGMTIDAAP